MDDEIDPFESILMIWCVEVCGCGGVRSLRIRKSGSRVEKFRTGIEQQQIVVGIYNIQRQPGVTV